MTTHTPAEWAAFLSLGVSVWAAASAVIYLLADAEASDFDPRPAVRAVIESGRLDPLLTVVGPAKADAAEVVADALVFARLSLRDAALTVAALLALLSPAAAPEATR